MDRNCILFDGDVVLTLEQEALHLKAVDPYGDPIELNAEMCRVLAQKLAEIAELIDD